MGFGENFLDKWSYSTLIVVLDNSSVGPKMPFPFKIIDLTHPLSKDTPSWQGSCGFKNEIKCDYQESQTDVKFRIQQIKMHAGIGTHMDAPAHCIPGGATVEKLLMENLAVSCVMIDVSEKAHRDFQVEPHHITAFEKKYGQIEKNSFVIFYTGWEKHWNDRIRYHNDYRFPSIGASCADLLLEREVAGLGIDTLSPDRPDSAFPLHVALLGAGKYIIENVAHAPYLPPKGSYSLALPMKIAEGTEAPLRLVALLDV